MSKKLFLRTLSLMISVCMLLSFAACNSSDKTDSDADAASEAVNQTDTAEGDDTASDNMSEKDNSSDKNSSSGKDNSANKDTSPKTQSTIKIDPSKKKTSLSKEEVISQMPKNLKGTTLTYMYWWNPKEQMEAEAIASFEKKTGIKLKPIVASYNGFYTEVAAKIAAGNSPDIVRLRSASTLTATPTRLIFLTAPLWTMQLFITIRMR